MNNSNRQALKSGFWYTVANFITKGAAFLTTPIFTRIMSQSDVGAFSNFSSWLSILLVIVTFDLFTSLPLARFDYEKKFDEYIASNLLLGSIVTVVSFLIVFSFSGFFSGIFSLNTLELLVMFVYFLFYPALQMYQTKCRIEYKYKSSILISVGSFVLSTSFSLLFVLLFEDKYLGRWIGYIIPLIVISAVLYFYLISKSKKVSFKYWKYALMISFPLIWHTLGNTILSSADRVMITNLCGRSDNALYSVAYMCAIVVQILWSSMNSAWAPWGFEMMNKNSISTLKKAAIPYSIFFFIVVFFSMLIAPELLYLMGGQKYMTAVYVIPPVMTAFVFQFLYAFYVDIELFSKKQHLIAAGTIVAALVNIGLNWIFIPIYGYIAAAYTTLAGYIMLFAFHFVIVLFLKKINWTNNTFNLFACALFLAIGLLMNLLYSFNVLRLIVLIASTLTIFLLLVAFRKEILYMIKYKSLAKVKEKINRVFKYKLKKEW